MNHLPHLYLPNVTGPMLPLDVMTLKSMSLFSSTTLKEPCGLGMPSRYGDEEDEGDQMILYLAVSLLPSVLYSQSQALGVLSWLMLQMQYSKANEIFN